MPFALRAMDKPDSAELRNTARPEHLEYLRTQQSLLLAGGALFDDAGNAIGSLLILDTEDRAVAETFAANDPFAKAGLFAETTINTWRKAFFDKADLT